MNIEILKKAILYFGSETQTNKLQEELLELSLVLNQIKCPTKDIFEMEAKLYDELADVKIMMAQAELIFDKKRIDLNVEIKLNKLKEKYFTYNK